MSEPAAYLATNPTHPSNADALVWKPKDWHITWEFKPLYLHPDPRIAELEAVLRECLEALECVPKHFGMKRLGKSTLKDSETRVMCHKAIAKIDEVLNGKE